MEEGFALTGEFEFSRWDMHEFEQMQMIASAALARAEGEVEVDGRKVVLPPDVEVFKTVHLQSKLFSGDAIPLYQMPGLAVLEILLLPHEPIKMQKMVNLLQAALGSKQEVELLGLLSMHELNEVLGQWVDKSQESEEKS